MSYDDYYKAQLQDAAAFQDFVVDACMSLLGLAVVQYTSKLYQQTVGESRTGVEIKYDKKYATTGNLWIELAEKATQRTGPYAQSGIRRGDNSWLFAIGNYDVIYLFPKRLLLLLAKTDRYKQIENGTKTSIGFLLPHADAEKYAAAVLTPNASEKVRKLTGDLSRLAAELHHDLLHKPEASLFAEA